MNNTDIDYKELDRKAILDYIGRRGDEVEVDSILEESGANRLRVYNLLWEMEHEGVVKVTRQDELETPEAVKLI